MPGFLRDHLRPLAGAASLHVLLFAIIAATAWRWTATQPPVPLAIEGVVVDERALPAASKVRRPTPAKTQPAVPAPQPVPARPDPPPPIPDDTAQRETEARAAREREAREQAAAQRQREQAAERARQLQTAEDAARKAAQADAARRKTAEEDARRKAAEAETRRNAAAVEQQARESELRQRLAAEEADASAVARSGVVDQYRAELEQAIERSWIRPPSAQPGLECTLHVTQAPGGTVLEVSLGACNGDTAVRESITNAVFRASPLPAPADPRAFERRLEIVFRPTE